MQKKITIKVLPSEAAHHPTLEKIIAQSCGTSATTITGFNIIKQSIDARGRQTWFQLTVNVFIDEPFQPVSLVPLLLKDVSRATKKVIVVGAGPAGLFTALRLIEHGIQPIVLERGKAQTILRRMSRSTWILVRCGGLWTRHKNSRFRNS